MQKQKPLYVLSEFNWLQANNCNFLRMIKSLQVQKPTFLSDTISTPCARVKSAHFQWRFWAFYVEQKICIVRTIRVVIVCVQIIVIFCNKKRVLKVQRPIFLSDTISTPHARVKSARFQCTFFEVFLLDSDIIILYLNKRPLDSYACPDQSRWDSTKLKTFLHA